MCRSCVVEDSYCICGTFRQPLPNGEHCGCETGDHCQWCGHVANAGPSVPAVSDGDDQDASYSAGGSYDSGDDSGSYDESDAQSGESENEEEFA